VDAYVQQLEDLLDEKMDSLSRFKQRVSEYRSQLGAEEQMMVSRNSKPVMRRN